MNPLPPSSCPSTPPASGDSTSTLTRLGSWWAQYQDATRCCNEITIWHGKSVSEGMIGRCKASTHSMGIVSFRGAACYVCVSVCLSVCLCATSRCCQLLLVAMRSWSSSALVHPCCLAVRLVCLCISVCLSAYLSVCLYVCLSVCLSVCMSVSLHYLTPLAAG